MPRCEYACYEVGGPWIAENPSCPEHGQGGACQETQRLGLFLLTQTERRGHDTHDACVVCAEDAEAARQIHPAGDRVWRHDDWWWDVDLSGISGRTHDRSWTSPDLVTVTSIGEAGEGVEPGVVLASYRGG